MTETATTRTTKRDSNADLEAFKRQVREEALRVQKDQGWCDDGLNTTLRNLGLPEKKNYEIRVRVTLEHITRVTVRDADSEEQAREQVFAEYQDDPARFVQSYYGRDYKYVSHDTPIPPNPNEAEVGDLDPTRDERDAARLSGTTNPGGVTRYSCENWNDARSYYCSRPRNHGGAQHVSGDGTRVTAVWPVDELHPASGAY